MRRIDTDITANVLDGLTTITYRPSLTNFKNGIRISSAVMKLSANFVGTRRENYTVLNGNDEIIDIINGDNESGYVFINVTDELQDFILSAGQQFKLTIEGEKGSYVNVDGSKSSVHISYSSMRMERQSSGIRQFTAGRAGNGEIDLSRGIIACAHDDIISDGKVLPVEIRHIYNSAILNSDTDYVDVENGSIGLPHYCCGNGWKLNIQQYLVEEIFPENLLNEEIAKKFTYVDSKGQHNYFEERYYYNLGEAKVYINASDVHIDSDKRLSCEVDGEYYDVFFEVSGSNGYTLKSKLDGFEGLQYLDSEVEEEDELKDAIRSTELNLRDNANSLNACNVNIALLALAYRIQNLQKENTELSNKNLGLDLKLQSDLKLANAAMLKVRQISFYDGIIHEAGTHSSPPEGVTASDEALTADDGKGCTNRVEDVYEVKNVADGQLDNIISDCGNEIKISVGNVSIKDYTMPDEMKNFVLEDYINEKQLEAQWGKSDSEQSSSYSNSLGIYSNTEALYIAHNETTVKDWIKEVLGEEIYNRLDMDQAMAFIMDGTDSYRQVDNDNFQIRIQIRTYLEQMELLSANRNELETKLQKYKLQLEKIKRTVPVHYITSEQGVVYGFAPSSVASVYRLVAVFDANNNAIIINYDGEKIDSVVDATDKVIEFRYEQDNDLIAAIHDDSGKIYRYEYDDSKRLVGIEYPDGTKSLFSYGNTMLESLISPNGYGLLFGYDGSGRVVSVDELAGAKQISEAGAVFNDLENGNVTICQRHYESNRVLSIVYQNCRATVVSDEYERERTYLFDSMGNPITIYENGARCGDEALGDYISNTHVTSYEYSNSKAAFNISPLPYAEDYLAGGEFVNQVGQVATSYPIQHVMENFLGGWLDGNAAYGIDSPIPFRYTSDELVEKEINKFVLPNGEVTSKYIICTLSDEVVDKIKESGKKDFVLGGWAKADSACVCRKHTDYCNHCGAEEEYDDVEKLYTDGADSLQSNRRFELRIELEYSDRVDEQYVSFDWMQTGWQYCAVPVAISENERDVLQGIRVIFDYSYNTGMAEVWDITLKEGQWDYCEYDKYGNKIYSENSTSEYVTTYEYDENRCIKSKMIKKDVYMSGGIAENEDCFIAEYFYSTSGELVKSIDYECIVTEYVRNEKGVIIKTLKYHKSAPYEAYCEERLLDDKGNEISRTNEFGEKVYDYEYVPGTGHLESIVDQKGEKIAYGYDENGMQLGMVGSSMEGPNTNRRGYTLGMLTSYEANRTHMDFSYDGFGRNISINLAGENYASIDYSEETENKMCSNGMYRQVKVGQKQTTTYGNDQVFSIVTDEDGNEKLAMYNGSPLYEKRYDTFGRYNALLDYSLAEPAGCDMYLDSYGNAISKIYKGYGREFAVGASYDQGVCVKKSFKFGNAAERKTFITYSNAPNRKVLGMQLPNGLDQRVKYDKLGRMSEVSSICGPNCIDSFISKNIYYVQKGTRTSNLVASEWFGRRGIVKDSINYTYDEKGNLTTIRENGKLVARYTYDGMSRLVREDNVKLGKTITIAYDNAGNIVMRSEYAYSLAAADSLGESKDIHYGYAADGWRDRLMSFGESVCGSYDSLGNPWLYRGKELVWTRGRCLATIGDVNYVYNAEGARISKTVNGITTRFYYDGTTLLAQESDNVRLYFNYGIDGIIGFTYNDGAEYFYKRNMLGDVIAILDGNGEEIVRYAYDAWGNHKTYVRDGSVFVEVTSGNGVGTDGQNNFFISKVNPIRYRSYYFDNETGLYYLLSRYYDPQVGRFINADDISCLMFSDVNGLNLFVYCRNNPIAYVDNTGNKSKKKWWQWVLGVVAVVVTVALVAITVGTILPAFGASAAAVSIVVTSGVVVGAASGLTVLAQQMKSDDDFNLNNVIISSGIGAAIGGLGAYVGELFGLSSMAVMALNTFTDFASTMLINFTISGETNIEDAAQMATEGLILGAITGWNETIDAIKQVLLSIYYSYKNTASANKNRALRSA